LKGDIRRFVQEVADFRSLYLEQGPMVEGIPPQEAMERLNRFSNEFEVKKKYYEINKKGEDLFGLQNQKYPALEQTNAEI
jgi:dynein heavy chain